MEKKPKPDLGKQAEQITRFLFTGPDKTEFERVTQQDDDGREGMRMDWNYVVSNIRRILDS